MLAGFVETGHYLGMGKAFSYTDFVDEAAKQSLSASAGKRMLKKAEKASFVKHEGTKYRKLPGVGGKSGS